jgi:hypothetical protein
MLLGVEHHLLVGPLGSELSIGIGGVKIRLLLLLLLKDLLRLLLVILVELRIKRGSSDVGRPGALRLLLHGGSERVGSSGVLLLLLLQKHLLLVELLLMRRRV